MYLEEGPNYTKAMKQFIELAAKWGAKPVTSGGKHLKFRDELGNQISAPKTSSDWRAIRNFKSELKTRGFVEQLPTKSVVKTTPSPSPQPQPTPVRQTANQQTTFKDFMDKVRPIVTDFRRPETLAARMERGWRQSIKDLPLRIKSEIGNKLIKQIQSEQKCWKGYKKKGTQKLFGKTYNRCVKVNEALTTQLIKGAARQIFRDKNLLQRVKNALPLQQTRRLSLPREVTGFQTARGSTYSFKQPVGNTPGSSTRIAADDPFHPTAPGTKQPSDWTIFTTPSAGQSMKTKWNQGVSRTEFFKGEPVAKTPAVGRSPVEVWNQYQGGGRAMHLGSRITDVRTQSRGGNVSLSGTQRQELGQRVQAALRNPRNRDVLRREIQSTSTERMNNLYRMRNNPVPQGAMSVEDMLRKYYRQNR